MASVVRVDAATVRLVLRREPKYAAFTAELAVRESGCCSFFTFTPGIRQNSVALVISVPPDRVDVLEAPHRRATAVSAGGAA